MMDKEMKKKVDALESVLGETSRIADEESSHTLPDTFNRSVMAAIYNNEIRVEAAESELWNIPALFKASAVCFTITIIALASISWGDVRDSYNTLILDIVESNSYYTEIIMERETL